MQFGFALQHGWSFQATSLAALSTALTHITPHVIVDDLGYWTDEPLLPQRDPGIAWIAVGHSFGFAGLVGEAATPWHAAIGISAFTTFPQDGLAAMSAATRHEPMRAVRAFRRRCELVQSMPVPPLHATGHQRLLAGLETLRTLDLARPACPTLFLHGDHDRIVPIPEESIVCAGARHGLGIDEVEWCVFHIQSFVTKTLRSL